MRRTTTRAPLLRAASDMEAILAADRLALGSATRVWRERARARAVRECLRSSEHSCALLRGAWLRWLSQTVL